MNLKLALMIVYFLVMNSKRCSDRSLLIFVILLNLRLEEDESEESDGELELHPLLTASLRRPIVPTAKRTPPVTKSEQPLPPGWTVVTTGLFLVNSVKENLGVSVKC